MTKLAVFSALLAFTAAAAPPPPSGSKPTPAQENAILGALSWHFEENRGQAPADTRYVSHGEGYQIEIRPGGPTLVSLKRGKRVEVRTLVIGANLNALITADEPSAMKTNYFLGNEENAWRRNIGSYSRVRYHDIYPNTDLIFYGAGKNLEFDFEVRPGGDPNQIAMTWKGSKLSHLDAAGNLIIATSAGDLRWSKPVIYQLHDGAKTAVDGGFVLSRNIARFQVDAYDHGSPLVIDPAIGFATFFGGSNNESAHAIAVDASGNILVAGITSTATLPTTGTVAQSGYGGSTSDSIAGDAFVAEFNATGSAINWLTYLGGQADDVALGLAIDTGGNIYVTGMTNSLNFPVKNANNATFSGSGGNRLNPMGDVFLTKLTPSGQLAYSTYFGGSQDDWAMAVAVDSTGNAYITGATLSINFPTQFTSYQKGFKGSGGNQDFAGLGLGPIFTLGDAFVAKFDGNGKIVWSTYLGGAKDEIGTSIAVDKSGNVYVAGLTLSSDFPVTSGVLQTKFGGASDNQSNPWVHLGDGFIAKLDSAGSNLLLSTYLGGSKDDGIFGMAVDSSGNIYVTGSTLSPDFPVTSSALQTTFKGPSVAPNPPRSGIATNAFGDGFVAKVNPQATALIYSTDFGGTGDDSGQAIAVDTAGLAYVTGHTASKDFPTTAGAPQTTWAGGGVFTELVGDAYFLQLNASGSQLLFSTFLGSSGDDAGGAVALDGNGNAYIAGLTTSPNFPVTKGAFQTTYGGNSRLGTPAGDVFVAKITGLGAGNAPVISNVGNAASYQYGVVSPGEIVVVFGSSMAAPQVISNAPDSNGVFGSTLAGTRVYFNNLPSPIVYTSAGQLSAIVPYALQGQSTANVQVEYNSVRSSNFPVTVQDAVPGLFTALASGSGPGAIYNGDGTANSSANPIANGGIIVLYLTGEGQTNPPSIDGRVANGTYPAIIPPVSVTVGGVPAKVLYAGAIPTLVAGISQINAQLDPSTPTGTQNVAVNIRGSSSQANVTVAIR